MNKFGVVKTKLLSKLTESYAKENKAEIKNILTTIGKNKDFKEMYLFYEEIENKFIEDVDTAKLYVEGVESMLKQQIKNDLSIFCETIDEKLGDVKIEKNELYESLDKLYEKDTLLNIEDKIVAKKNLISYLTKKKESKEINKQVYSENENLLHAVLTNNFNVLYSNTLTENEKKTLKDILSVSNEELVVKTSELKESINSQIDSLLNESTDGDFKMKLNKVKNEVQTKETSRVNYYRLMELKNGLN